MPRLLTIAAILAFTTPAFATIPHQTLTLQELREYNAVSRFVRAVDEYALMRRIVEPLPPETMCLPDGTIARINELAATPFDARPVPIEGDLFAPEVAEVFRDRLATAIKRSAVNVWDLVSDMNEEELLGPPAAVRAPLPWAVGERSVEWLTAALPILPEGMEYRLAGRDLVILDTHANVVADVLRVAVPLY